MSRSALKVSAAAVTIAGVLAVSGCAAAPEVIVSTPVGSTLAAVDSRSGDYGPTEVSVHGRGVAIQISCAADDAAEVTLEIAGVGVSTQDCSVGEPTNAAGFVTLSDPDGFDLETTFTVTAADGTTWAARIGLLQP
jgi:hypothetical protein